MSLASFPLLLALATVFSSVAAQSGTPLYQKKFDYNKLPYQADTDDGERGRQFGYNICNSTTEGPTSNCQTALINSLDDFCLWGPPEPNSVIGNTEGESVAWCTKEGRGARLIPAGALTGVQFMRTPAYVQIVGHINQSFINIDPEDGGGEMDPHGADQRGNPLGGLVFSNAFPSNNGNNKTFQQVSEWHNFMGSNVFCFKACDPAGANAAQYCQHIYDRIGCQYNAPAAYEDGVFLSCDGANQDFPGIYTDAAGQVQTYTQPPEAAGEISTMPYNATIPASSNCKTFASTDLFTAAGTPTTTPSTSSPTGTGTGTSSRATGSTTASGTRSGATTTSTESNAANVRLSVDFGGFGGLLGAAIVCFALGGGALAVL